MLDNLQEDISYIFKIADKDNSGTLTMEEFNDAIKDIRMRYPQIDLYLERQRMTNATKLLEGAAESGHNKTVELNIEQFKSALTHVDSQMKTLPATAQVIILLFFQFIILNIDMQQIILELIISSSLGPCASMGFS